MAGFGFAKRFSMAQPKSERRYLTSLSAAPGVDERLSRLRSTSSFRRAANGTPADQRRSPVDCWADFFSGQSVLEPYQTACQWLPSTWRNRKLSPNRLISLGGGNPESQQRRPDQQQPP